MKSLLVVAPISLKLLPHSKQPFHGPDVLIILTCATRGSGSAHIELHEYSMPIVEWDGMNFRSLWKIFHI